MPDQRVHFQSVRGHTSLPRSDLFRTPSPLVKPKPRGNVSAIEPELKEVGLGCVCDAGHKFTEPEVREIGLALIGRK